MGARPSDENADKFSGFDVGIHLRRKRLPNKKEAAELDMGVYARRQPGCVHENADQNRMVLLRREQAAGGVGHIGKEVLLTSIIGWETLWGYTTAPAV